MKAPKGMGTVVDDLAERLRTAATTPALTVAQPAEVPTAPVAQKPEPKAAVVKSTPAKRVKGAGAAVSVFLRVPLETYAELDKEAVRLTKQTGKGVTVQQVILGKIQARP